MYFKKQFVLVSIVLFCCVFFIAADFTVSAEAVDPDDSTEIVRYQADWNYPPYKYVDNYSLTGFDIDLTRMIFEPKGYEVQFKLDGWSNMIDRLQSGEVDTCGLVVFDENKKNEILFSDVVLNNYISIYSKKGNDTVKYTLKMEELSKYRIGVGAQNFAEEILLDELGITPYRTYETINESVRGLDNGEIDLLFENQAVVNYILIQQNLISQVEARLTDLYPVRMAYGISKDKPELVTYINRRLGQLKKSGVYEELYMKHFNTHSQYYYDHLKTTAASYILTIIVFLLLVFILLQLYITRLRKKLSHEQVFSKGIIENAGTMIIICSSDGTILMFNKFAQEVTGYSSDETEGKRIYHIPVFNEGTELGKQIYECVTKDISKQNMETHLTVKNKRIIHVLWNINVIKDSANNPMNIIAMGVDITDRKNAESRLTESYMELESVHGELVTKEIELHLQYDDLNIRGNELKRSEERYRLAVEGVNDGIWDWDGKDGKLFMSKRSRMIMGFEMDKEYFTIEKWFNVILSEDQDRFVRNLNKYITEPQKKHFQIEYRIQMPDNKIKWIRTRGMATWDKSGIPIRVAGSITDITEQKLSDEKIHQLAYYDAMTGLPNRSLLMDRFIIAAANAQRKGKKVAVFFLDLDNFKTINDTIGHSFGDELLLKVGEQLKMKLRKSDTLARLGGDEFIMLQANVKDMEEVFHLAVRMLEIFKSPWVLDKREFYVTASIGISIYPNDGSDLQELMKNADAAMYRAKESGKNNFQVFTQELNLRIMQRMEIESNLRKATERNEFLLYYQPQIELATGKTIGVEALIRWSNPTMGWIMPDSFIHIAEEIGLINNIGEWVLQTACIQLAQWQAEGYSDLKISVNLSAKQFQQQDLVERVALIIEETGIKAKFLELEITESLAMNNLDHTISILERFKDMGIGVSLDDFGKGYSSLNYLKMLPITNLKIDKTFIHGITNNSKQAKIAKALISLAHNMNLSVTAEGVENETQLDFLIKESCDIVQGFLFSKPKLACDLELDAQESYMKRTS